MSVGHLHTTLFGEVGPEAADLSARAAAAGAGGLTTGRLLGTVAALVALTGVVLGGRALVRAADRVAGRTRNRGAVALAAGLTGMAVGGYVVAVADGGPGTGYGIVGGVAALAIGLVATVLGGLVVVRARRAG